MTYCEVANRECAELGAQVDDALSLGIYPTEAFAIEQGSRACHEGLETNAEQRVAASLCGLDLLNEQGGENA